MKKITFPRDSNNLRCICTLGILFYVRIKGMPYDWNFESSLKWLKLKDLILQHVHRLKALQISERQRLNHFQCTLSFALQMEKHGLMTCIAQLHFFHMSFHQSGFYVNRVVCVCLVVCQWSDCVPHFNLSFPCWQFAQCVSVGRCAFWMHNMCFWDGIKPITQKLRKEYMNKRYYDYVHACEEKTKWIEEKHREHEWLRRSEREDVLY